MVNMAAKVDTSLRQWKFSRRQGPLTFRMLYNVKNLVIHNNVFRVICVLSLHEIPA